jgi:hypothetical protein
MRAAPPLVFPSSRVLAGWWPQLASLAPQSLTVGHLLLHHVEALVLSERTSKLDAFTTLVLRALMLAPPRRVAELEGFLHLGPQVVGGVLRELAHAGLAEADAAGAWRLTAAGRQAQAAGRLSRPGHERRAFHFRDGERPGFVPLPPGPCHTILTPDGWRFDYGRLNDCVGRPPEWKRRHGFPEDVRAVLTADEPGEPPAWRRVIVDQAEHLVLTLVVSAEGGGGQLYGFAVEPRGWTLERQRPRLRLGPGWAEVFPEAAADPPPEAWRGAWRTWCQGHGLAPGEADACTLGREGVLLRVRGPREVLGRLPSPNGAAPREDVWLLAGEGHVRTAARVDLVTPLAA